MQNLKINYRKFIYPFIIFSSVILLDQFTKALATYFNNHLFSHHNLIGKFVTFQYTTNTGAAFSSGQGHQMIFNAIAIIIVIFSLWAAVYLITSLFTIGILLMGAGALSNCIERLATNKVTDFIQVSFGSWTFPGIFNIADSCVCIGAGILILAMILFAPSERIFDNHDNFIFSTRAEIKVVNKIDKFEHETKNKGLNHINKIIDKTENRLNKKRIKQKDNKGVNNELSKQ